MYWPYVKHEQEKEDIIKMVISAIESGETDVSLDLDDYFSDDDLEYIKMEIDRRMR